MKDEGRKLIALLEGLQIRDIERFTNRAKIGAYRNLGKRYFSKADYLRETVDLLTKR